MLRSRCPLTSTATDAGLPASSPQEKATVSIPIISRIDARRAVDASTLTNVPAPAQPQRPFARRLSAVTSRVAAAITAGNGARVPF